MGQNTPNHDYYKPDRNEKDWGDEVNQNFDDLDADVIVKDTFANRPAAPAAGSWFLATDRRILYHYDGSTWGAIAGVGTSSNPVPGTQHYEAVSIGDVNGVRYVDPDTSDVGAAVNSILSDLAPGGGRIVLPRGDVPISTQIDLNPTATGMQVYAPIILEGHGATRDDADPTGTTLDASGMTGPAGVAATTGNQGNIYLRDFTVANATNDGIEIGTNGYCRDSAIENVIGAGCGGYGLKLQGFYGGSVDNIEAHNTDLGLWLKDCNACHFGQVRSRSTQTNTPAIDIHGGDAMHFGVIYSESNAGPALRTSEKVAETFIGAAYIENNNTSASADYLVWLGDNSVATGVDEYNTFNGFHITSQANTGFTTGAVVLERVRSTKLSGWRSSFGLVDTTNVDGADMVFDTSVWNTVNLDNISTETTWIANRINTLTSRTGTVVVVSGD